MTRLVVRAAWGYTPASPTVTWTDITEWVEIQTGVRITRGARDELSETQPGTLTLTLDNADGRFTAGNAASPYYPYVRTGVPLQVLVVSADTNLVQEGSFEPVDGVPGTASFTGWEDGDPAPINWFQDSDHVHTGTQSMLINWLDSGSDSGIVQTTLYGLEIGATYTASAQVYVETGRPAVRLQVEDVATGDPSTLNDQFEQISVTFTATAAVHVLQITTDSATPASGDRVWVDAVQVEEGSSAGAFSDSFAELHYRGFFMAGDWPTRWAGLHSTVTMTATDVFKWLSLQPELQAMLVEEVLLDEPLAYYPLSEPEESTSAGDLSGEGAGALSIVQAGSGGTLLFGQEDQGPADGLRSPTFTPASSTAGKYLRADLGQGFVDSSSANWLFLEAWFTTSTKGRTIFAVESTVSSYMIRFSLDSGTGQMVVSYSSEISSGSSTAASGDLADGEPHHLVWDEQNDNLYIDTVRYTLSSVSNMILLRQLSVGGYNGTGLWDGQISHVALHAPASGTVAPGDLTSHYTIGATEMIGETADARMERLITYVGLGVETEGTAFDGMGSQAALGRTPLEHLREIERTEAGKIVAHRQLSGLVFQSRDVRFNPVSALSLAYEDLETEAFEFSGSDDQKLINIMVATRPGGATQRVTAPNSITAFGRYERRVELLKEDDESALDAAYFAVNRYAVPQPEVRQMPVQIYTMPLATYRTLLDADVSTVLTITGLPDEAPSPTATVTIEGYEETIQHNQHLINFHTSRADTDSVWVLDDATYSVLGTTTRLAY